MDKEREFDYKKDKSGWVKFTGKHPKIKLRKYIAQLATDIANMGKGSISFNKIKLIEGYNTHGIGGIEHVSKLLIKMDMPNDKVV